MTPVVLCIFLLLSRFLAALNVPLSAYNINQEFTYRPNDTLPHLPLSNMIPAILQHPSDGFTPQILNVGDVIRLNNSVFNYTIAEVYDADALENGQPVSSFSYFNNPFSDGCDVINMTANMALQPYSFNSQVIDLLMDYTVVVNCHIPTLFTLSWSGNRGVTSLPFQFGTNPPRDNFNFLAQDLASVLLQWPRPTQNTDEGAIDQLTTLRVTVRPCCNCPMNIPTDPAVDADNFAPSQPPCRLLPARLQATQLYVEHSADPVPFVWQGPNSTDIFSGLPTDISPYFNNSPLVAFNNLFQNAFQSLYHLSRLELGVVVENQIYASPEMYNRSISPVYVPDIEGAANTLPSHILPDAYSTANISRASTSNETLMSEWISSVRSFNDSDRVPVMLYLRSVPHWQLKPLGSAIISVFVSTFAMVSALWSIFNVIAGAYARSHTNRLKNVDLSDSDSMDEKDSNQASLFSPAGDYEIMEHLRLTVDNNTIRTNVALAEMQLAMVRMHRSLRKSGLLEDVDEVHSSGIEMDHGLKEELPLLSHRATAPGDSRNALSPPNFTAVFWQAPRLFSQSATRAHVRLNDSDDFLQLRPGRPASDDTDGSMRLCPLPFSDHDHPPVPAAASRPLPVAASAFPSRTPADRVALFTPAPIPALAAQRIRSCSIPSPFCRYIPLPSDTATLPSLSMQPPALPPVLVSARFNTPLRSFSTLVSCCPRRMAVAFCSCILRI
ncbi:hypothetical protein C8R45DRAFT_1114671 [Mycena sanguinolenta]|nr:hypothetical protein C8R45DRAFT_1114671 [Mycena sanguinolenta]